MSERSSQFLTTAERAARWRKFLSVIDSRKDRGQLPFYRLRGSISLRLDEMDAYEADTSRRARGLGIEEPVSGADALR
jgi:hypothetical protein